MQRKTIKRSVIKPRPPRTPQPALTVTASPVAGSARNNDVPKDSSAETVRDLRIIFAAYEHPIHSTITIAQLKEIFGLMDGPAQDLLSLESRLASQNIGEHLNFKSFLTFFIYHMEAQSIPVRRRELFRYIDSDNSGELTCEELRVALAKMGMVLTADEASAMVSVFEGPVDGLISFQEFKKLCRTVDEIRKPKEEEVLENSNNVETRIKHIQKLHMPSKICSSTKEFRPNTSSSELHLSTLFSDRK